VSECVAVRILTLGAPVAGMWGRCCLVVMCVLVVIRGLSDCDGREQQSSSGAEHGRPNGGCVRLLTVYST
jgi:hypothetical protein